MNDESILHRLEQEGRKAPRVALSGTQRRPAAGEQRYQLLGEIARGGVGVVHRGHDTDLGRDVALKLLHDEHLKNQDLVQRFIEEAQVGGQLQHPGIVPVYELGLDRDQRPFFAMKLVKGETLAKRLDGRKDPASNFRELMTVFRDVCRTMSYAHARGVIHRDLKPSNVMIGGFGEVQVVDWGLAKVLGQGGVADERLRKKADRDVTMIATVRSKAGSQGSLVGSVMGTPAYMPPEQAAGRIDDLDERSDIFSLGAILCEILTGRPPYTGDATSVLTAAALADQGDARQALEACTADPSLVELCRHCLEPLPKRRPASAELVADAIASWLAQFESQAHRAELAKVEAEADADEKVRARRQGRRVAVGVVGLVTVAVVSLLVVNHGQAERERELRRRIDTATEEAVRLQGAGDWDAALAAAEQAIELGADPALLAEIRAAGAAATERARILAEDDAFLAELEEVRGGYGQGSAAGSDDQATDAAYTAAFARRFGSVEGSVERLAASSHRQAFAANLDFWCWVVKIGLQAPRWREIDRVTRQIDADHGEVRDAVQSDDLQALRRLAAEGGDELPLALASQVGLALANKHPEDAVAFLARQHLRAPDDFWINMRLCYAAVIMADFERAVRHATSAVALRPAHAKAWASLAYGLSRTGDREGAIAAGLRASELEPENLMVVMNLGADHFYGGNLEAALAVFERAVQMAPGFAQAHLGVGHTCFRSGRYEDAIRAFRIGLDLATRRGTFAHAPFTNHPDHAAKMAETWFTLGKALDFTGDLGGAIQAFRESAAFDGSRGETFGALGGACFRAGEYADSAAAYRALVALASGPVKGRALGALADALRWSGDTPGAIAAWCEAVELDPATDRTQLQELEREYALAPAVDRLIAGEAVESAPADEVVIAVALHFRRRFDLAVAAYARAFARDPALAAPHRYNAACSASLAGPAHHPQALEWLRADLERLRPLIPRDRDHVKATLEHWRQDRDLAPVRDVPDLAADLRRLWAGVDALLAEAAR